MATKHHEKLSRQRLEAFAELFGGEPTVTYRDAELVARPDKRIAVDVFAYLRDTPPGPVFFAVTSGLSDVRMKGAGEGSPRRELVQCLRRFDKDYAGRPRSMAWLPLFDGFALDARHTVEWPDPAKAGTPWKNALFLDPIIRSHRKFAFDLEGDEVRLLWHVPISDAELEYKRTHGADALIDRMSEVKLPWVFDEADRPPLV